MPFNSRSTSATKPSGNLNAAVTAKLSFFESHCDYPQFVRFSLRCSSREAVVFVDMLESINFGECL